jgi:hypothetical protein
VALGYEIPPQRQIAIQVADRIAPDLPKVKIYLLADVFD